MNEYKVIPKSWIKIPKDYPREFYAKRQFTGNIIYDIVVTGNYTLVDGLGRLEKRKGHRVKVIIRRDITEKNRLFWSIVLNLQRKELNAIALAKSFKKIMKQNKWSGRELSRQLKISNSKVEYYLKLLELPQFVQNRIRLGKTKAYALEEMIYGKKISSKFQFDKLTTEKQFASLLNKLTSFKQYFPNSKLNINQLGTLYNKILEIQKILEEKLNGRS